MRSRYTLQILSSGTWICPAGSPGPDAPADLSVTIEGIDGPLLKPNTPSQNISGSITLEWLPVTAPVRAKITIPAAVLFPADRSVLQSAWETFLGQLDNQVNSQFMQPSGARNTGFIVAQNMPMLCSEIAYYRLRFNYTGTGNYIDLQPGMRLTMSYGNFYNEAHSGSGQQLKRFSATGSSFADLQSDETGRGLLFNTFMDLQQITVLPAVNLGSGKVRVLSNVLDLAGQPVKPYHRLFYPATFSGTDTAGLSVADSIYLVSASCYQTLAQPLQNVPVAEVCNPLLPKIYPSVFFGRCVVTVQLPLRVNGRSVYAAAGSTVRNIIETSEPSTYTLSALKISRYLNEQKADISFPASDPSVVLDMLVLPGDEVVWLPQGNFQLVERLQAIYRISAQPDALTLENLAIASFGDIDVSEWPAADDMAVALLLSHDKPAPYTSSNIAVALYTAYNKGVLKDTYSGAQLAYSLYFAGFAVSDVSIGVVAAYQPPISMQNGGVLVSLLLLSGIGYQVNDVSTGVYVSLGIGGQTNAYYLVQSLIEGSLQAQQPYSPGDVAAGTLNAVGYAIADAYLLSGALIQGSSLAAPAKTKYISTDTAAALYYAFNTISQTLTQNNMAMALAKPFFGQAPGYAVNEVALGVFSVFPGSDAVTIAGSLINAGVGYTMNDVALGTFAIRHYNPGGDHTLTVAELAATLFNAYGSAAENTPVNVAVALVYTINTATVNEVASAVANAFGYVNVPSYVQGNINNVSLAVVTAFKLNGGSSEHTVSAATALVFAFANINATQLATALVSGFGYTASGTNLTDMTLTCGAVVTALSYSKTDQSKINLTGAALKNAFAVNMGDQANVVTLAKSLVSGFTLTDASLLSIAIVATGAYAKGANETFITAQATGIAMGYDAASQPNMNALASALNKAFVFDKLLQADVTYLSSAFFKLNNIPVNPSINGIAIQSVFNYSASSDTHVLLLATAITKAYSLSGSSQSDVNTLVVVLVNTFHYELAQWENLVLACRGITGAFGFVVGSQANINTAMLALVIGFNVPNYNTYKYNNTDLVHITMTFKTTFSTISLLQVFTALQVSFPLLLPVDAGSSVSTAYALNPSSNEDTAALGTALATYYQLKASPYAVPSLSIIMFQSGFAFMPTSKWMGNWVLNWKGDDFAFLTMIYNNSSALWTTALNVMKNKPALNDLATTIQQQADASHADAPGMVKALAACYNYLDLSKAINPVGVAMKTAGYSFSQTSGAMGNGQYHSQWTPDYFNQLLAIFST